MKYLLFIIIFSAVTIISASSVFAHDLISEEVRNYIEEHPDATAGDIEEFVRIENIEGGADSVFAIPEVSESLVGFSLGYIHLGIVHILSGADHILFIIAIVLSTIGIFHIFRMSILFTLAHSVTFIFAGTTAMTISARIVEPLIALSISIVALMAVWSWHKKTPTFAHKGSIIFLFGLIHGLGFAGLLKDIHIPDDVFLWGLLLFNVGIEIGQVLILLIALPFIWAIRKWKYVQECQTVVAVALVVIGFAWTIERIGVV